MQIIFDKIRESGNPVNGIVLCEDGTAQFAPDYAGDPGVVQEIIAASWNAAKLAESAAAKGAEITALAEASLAAYGAEYGPTERASWPVQLREAEALQADPGAATPWLDAAATARGMDKATFAARIVANAAAWSPLQGWVNGQRLKFSDQLGAILAGEGTDTEKAEAIQAMRVGYELPGA
jgi:hypothetical protein